ncbi:MAG: glutamate synthase subunit beta [Candidatus Omnitrophica bacterium]|nr:glutamate synthase subunit beta [Candidatus Omnitrophota bacterium]MDD5487702.1 glutamate synthase subunit beta [Candidatus Omnitrophota bacterium]
MGDPKGFMKVKRQASGYRPVCERVADYGKVSLEREDPESERQASRCMDCGVPFCHWGCPVGNYIPEWNDLLFRGQWEKAFELLDASNNLPEMTGRVCPALCEYACVLGVNDDAVTIRENEHDIIEHAFRERIIKPRPPKIRTGKKVAVIGSGPAGLSCAAQLNKAGHEVTVFEKDDRVGGLLRYGIPDFKLEKSIVDRRVKLMSDEGVKFMTGVCVGKDKPARDLLKKFDAVCLAGGSRVPRDIKIDGRELSGICFAMDYLSQANRRVQGDRMPSGEAMDAKGKKVVVIGGGDTGSDCVGTAHRQGAACVVQIELMPRPPECRTDEYPWPRYPLILKTSTSHEEGGQRQWSVLTKRFTGSGGVVNGLDCVNVEFEKSQAGSCPMMKEVPESGFHVDADLVLIAAGFLHPEPEGLLSELGVELDKRGNVRTDDTYKTSVDKVFAAGDMRRGQSLVVWAIQEGRKAARSVDEYLMGASGLPSA